ncbi:MAG: septum formation inhibitor Maf [Acidobacteria bacterium]|nr:septum formation inhibitor Maf [Acidobacteriota bacterium]
MTIVLASASPRRAALLTAAGFAFTIRVADADETPHVGEAADALVQRLALTKAHAVPCAAGELVLAADTTVVCDGAILNKPADAAEAARMLRRLSGRAHEVLTGVALRSGDDVETFVERTVVWMAPLDENDIAWYVASGEPEGKAGAYGIQGLASRFVTRIDGSYTNVVGLPVAQVAERLRRWGARG